MTTVDVRPRRAVHPARTVGVLAFGAFAVGTGLFALAGVLPAAAAALETTEGAAGQSVTVFAVTYAVAAPLLATVAGRFSPRLVLGAALGVFVLGNALTAAAPSLVVLLASRIVAAVGAAAYTPVALGAAAAIVPVERRGRALATVMGGLNGSIAVGVPLGILLSRFATWRATVVLVAALGLVAAVVLAVTVRELPPIPRTSVREGGRMLGDRRVTVILVVTVFSVAAGISAYTYIASLLRSTVGADGLTFLVLVALYGVGAFAGSLVAGRLTDRFGPNRTATASIVLLVGVLIAIPFLHVLVVVAVVVVAWGAAFVAVVPPQQVRLIALAPDSATVAVSLNSSGTYVGQALGAGVGGAALGVGLNVVDLPFAAAALALVALFVHLVSVRSERRRAN